jgi:DNA-binding NarL/FixJ family response regulator
MMRSIVEDVVASQPDLRLAGTWDDSNLEEAVARSEADVLIVEERADRQEVFYRSLLVTHPSLKVLVLTQDGRNATLMGLRRVRLADTSPTTLIEAIRSEPRGEATPNES